MAQNGQHAFRKISGIRVIYPVLIGLGVIIFFLIRDFKREALQVIHVNGKFIFFIGIAILLMLMRDIGYMFRIRILTHEEGFEMGTSIPCHYAVGIFIRCITLGRGTSVATIYVHKEGINLGRSTAVIMATSFLDELYFILMFPILLGFIHVHKLFAIGVHEGVKDVFSLSNEFLWFAVIGYSMKFIYKAMLVLVFL